MRLLALFLLASSCFAAVPTITGQSASNITHTSFHYTATVSPTASYVQLFVGTSSGVYTTQTSPSYLATANDGGGFVKLSISGLTPSTTYYVCLKARPNQDDDTDITSCATMGYEITVTTTANVTHPVVPADPDEYAPTLPDMTGYTTVSMACLGSPTIWRAAANVTNPGDWSGNVSSGDTLQTVLNTVYFGTIIQFPQSTTCANPTSNSTGTGEGALSGVGWYLPYKTVEGVGINSNSHRWIVLRTSESTATDFPPSGVQIDPTWTKLAYIQATGTAANPSQRGQCFLDDGGVSGGTAPTHHYYIYHVGCTADPTLTGTDLAGTMIQIGRPASVGVAANPPDYVVLDQIVIRGAQNADTLALFSKLGKHVALQNSYLDRQQYLNTDAGVGVKIDSADKGFFSLRNTYIKYINGFGAYCEANAGETSTTCFDTVLRRNRIYLPVPSPNSNSTYRTRQPIEFKRGTRILVEGNIIDGSQSVANEAPLVMASGNGDTDSATNSGVHDMRVRKNIGRNGQTAFDCMAVRPNDNPGPPDNIVNSTIYVDNNWFYNMGAYNHRAGGGGLSASKIWHAPGCVDFTFTQNTLNRFDNRDSWAGFDLVPGIERSTGGSTFAEGHYFTNNILYPDYGTGAATFNGRFDVADDQKIASHPSAPLVNLASTPAAFWDSFSVRTTNGTITPYYNFDGNVMIPGYKNTGSNTWAEMNSGDLAALQSGMPGTNTWATGNTLAAREANVGFTPATGRCTGCSGAGADIDAIYSAAGIVTNIATPTPASTSLAFSYTAPDSDALPALLTAAGPLHALLLCPACHPRPCIVGVSCASFGRSTAGLGRWRRRGLAVRLPRAARLPEQQPHRPRVRLRAAYELRGARSKHQPCSK
jgi:hypothetical protein